MISYLAVKHEKAAQGVFEPGDKVQKRTGYAYPGIVLTRFRTILGLWRYVVEADDPDFKGMLHIFSADQLELRE
jgi:hypothetical protein